MFEFNFRIFSTALFVANDMILSMIFIFFKYEYEKKCEKNVKTREAASPTRVVTSTVLKTSEHECVKHISKCFPSVAAPQTAAP